jgi:hypothetical protein
MNIHTIIRPVARLSGPGAMLGGALWITYAILLARLPEGCVESACDLPGRSPRADDQLTPLIIVSALLITVGIWGVAIRARHSAGFGKLGRIGLSMAGVGVALLTAGNIISVEFFAEDYPAMPWYVIPGMLLLVSGLVCFGCAILRSAAPPRGSAVLLIVGTLALLGFNDQNSQALMAIPFGVAWIVGGYVLWSQRALQPTPGAAP